MKLSDISFWLSELICPILNVDGLLFLDRNSEGVGVIIEKISSYEDSIEAQRWMNIVPLGDFFQELSGNEWYLEMPDAEAIALIYKNIFKVRIKMEFPDVETVIKIWRDEDPYDIGILVSNSP